MFIKQFVPMRGSLSEHVALEAPVFAPERKILHRYRNYRY
jgi:hypothetical protein